MSQLQVGYSAFAPTCEAVTNMRVDVAKSDATERGRGVIDAAR